MQIRSHLTKRHSEVLEFILQGKSNRQIGELLLIKEKTVKGHCTEIYKFHRVKNRIGLVLRFTNQKDER